MAIGRGNIPKEIGVGGGRSTKRARGGKVTSTAGKAKVAKVMHEWGQGQLHSGSKKGPQVKNQKQAVAIALSEARKASKK